MTGLCSRLRQIPYAEYLRLDWTVTNDGVIARMPGADRLIGNPMLPALHGGATAALLELAATAEVARCYPALSLPRPVNVTVSYLRSGRVEDTRATAVISRAGRRIIHVEARAWQGSEDNVIAGLVAHFLIRHGN